MEMNLLSKDALNFYFICTLATRNSAYLDLSSGLLILSAMQESVVNSELSMLM